MLEYLFAQLLVLFVLVSILGWMTGRLIFNRKVSFFWFLSVISRFASRASVNLSKSISGLRKDLWRRSSGGFPARILILLVVAGLMIVQFIVAIPAELVGTVKK